MPLGTQRASHLNESMELPEGSFSPPPRFGRREWATLLLATLLSSLLLPFLFIQSLFEKRLRTNLSERFGGGSWNACKSKNDSRIWFHAASVGEVAGISSLVEQCQRAFPQSETICSTTSITGRAEALRRKLAPLVAILPYDHPLFVYRVFRIARPRLLVLAETELWPCFILTGRLGRHQMVLINARISDRSFKNYFAFRYFVRPLLQSFTCILAQTERDRKRFVLLGANPEKVLVTGSTKYSQRPADATEAKEITAVRFGIDLARPCIVAGCVRAEEDAAVISAFCEARKSFPELQMIIAPRHPERFDIVADLLRSHGVAFRRRSVAEKGSENVLLLDTIGELQSAYSLGSVCFVGGTLVPVGGHNPFEPAGYGNPILLGPHYQNARDAVEQLLDAGGVKVMNDHRELAQEIEKLLKSPELRQQMGDAARETWRRNAEAVSRVLPIMKQLLVKDYSGRC